MTTSFTADARADEGTLLAASELGAFLSGLARVTLYVAALSAFLAEWRATDLPYPFAAAALVAWGAARARNRVLVRVGRAAAEVTWPALFAIILLVLRVSLYGESLAPSVVFILAALALGELLGERTDATVDRRLGRLQRVFFGTVLEGAGEGLASVGGGLALWLVSDDLAVFDLLYLAVLARAASALVPLVGRTSNAGARRDAPPGDARVALSVAKRDLYIAAILGVSVAATLAVWTASNAFFLAAPTRYGTASDLAGVLGLIQCVVGVGQLVLHVAAADRWRRWLGLKFSLLGTPASLLVLGSVVVASSLSSESHLAAFSSVLVLHVAVRLLSAVLDRPAFYALLQPLPPATRADVEAALTGTLPLAASSSAALVLLVLRAVSSLTVLSTTMVALLGAIAWVAFAWIAGQRHSHVLTSALRQQRVGASELELDDPRTQRVLEEGLESDQPTRVLYSLQLMDSLGHPEIEAAATKVLARSEPAVIELAANILERRRPKSAAIVIYRRLASSSLRVRTRATLLRALVATDPSFASRLAPLLDDPDPTVRCGAIVGLHRYGGPEGADRARPALLKLLRASDPRERRRGADVLAEIEDPARLRHLAALLRDPEIPVRRQAVRTALRIGDDTVWPEVVACLEEHALRADAIEALSRAGSAVIGPLKEKFAHTGDVRVKQAVAVIFGRIGGAVSEQFLLDELKTKDRELELELLRGLERAGYRTTDITARGFRRRLDDELQSFLDLLVFERDLADTLGADLVIDALVGEREQIGLRILLTLSMLHDRDALREVRDRLASGERDQVVRALELLDSALPESESARVLPVFEPLDLAERIRRLAKRGTATERTPDERLGELLDPKKPWAGTWLGTAARALQTSLARARPESPEAAQALELVAHVRSLRTVDLFSRVRGRALATLARRSWLRELEKGERLHAAGDVLSSLVIVTAGRLYAMDEVSHDLDRVLGATLLVPEVAASDVHADARTRALLVPVSAIDELFAEDVDAASEVLEALCRRMRSGHAPSSRVQPMPERTLERSTGLWRLRSSAADHSTVQRVLALRETELFGGLEDSHLAAIAEVVSERVLHPGERVFSAGDRGSTMFILIEGEVRVHLEDETIAMVEAPNVFGELAAISPAPRMASVTATRPGLVLLLERTTLHELMRTEPALLALMRAVILKRLGAGGGAVASDDTLDLRPLRLDDA